MHNEKRLLALAVFAACGGQLSTAAAQGGNAGVEEVLVYGTQGARETSTGSRLDLTWLETPATVDIINGDAIRDRGDIGVLEAVTRSGGFTTEANPGNGGSSISARGFEGAGAVTKLYDGTSYFNAAGAITFPFDTWGIDRIEVLKGPSSVLYGEGGIGGAINVIPRKPQREQDGQVRVELGEDDTTFIGVDYTNALGANGAYRFDYSNVQSDGWVGPNGDSDAEMLSLAFEFEPTDKLTLAARLDSGEQHPMRYFGAPVVNGDFVRDFVGKNFNVSDADIHYQDDSLRLRADWQPTDTVTLQAELFRLESDRLWKDAEANSYDPSTRILTRFDPLILGHDIAQDGVRTNLVFAPSRGRVRTSVGFEANDVSFERPTNFATPANPNGITFDEFDEVDPYNFVPGVLADITTAPVALDNTSDVSEWAVFAETQIKATERVAFVAALRHEDYDTHYVRIGRQIIDQNVDDTTGRVGVVFDVSDETALYAQYGTGATNPSGGIVTIANANRLADMIESEQLEVGVKHQVSGTGFQWNLALFDITKNNLTYDDPTSADPADVLVIPEQTSQGIELGFTYAATSTFQVYGNVVSLNAETDTGERPPTYVPEETYNLGFAWQPGTKVKIIADVRHVGDRFGGPAPDGITIPDYTVVDASVRWSASDKLGVTVKGQNLFDELYATSNYYTDMWMVGRPRTASVAFDYRF
ncbi:MAG TPA: TonB-dependent receptor [Gammaproteobacteria bacterium]|nr:TonB-dependent receptor [Gammaproteobacteria bacterium]